MLAGTSLGMTMFYYLVMEIYKMFLLPLAFNANRLDGRFY
jgi:hypothetical protein